MSDRTAMASNAAAPADEGRRRMTIGRQVLLGFLLPVLLMMVMVAVATVELNDVARAKNVVIQRDAELVADAYRLRALTSEQSAAARAYFLTANDRDLQTFRELNARYATLQAELTELVHTDDGRLLLDEIGTRRDAWLGAVDEVFDAVDRGVEREAVAELAVEGPFLERQALDAAVEAFIDRQNDLIAEGTSESDAAATRAYVVVWVIGAAALVLALLLAALISRRTTASLGSLARDVDRSSSEILAGTTQQVTASTEQASAVQETVATVDELVQTAQQAASRARSVADRAQRSAEVAQDGKQAVEDAAQGMEEIREQVDAIAQHVVALAERAQAISDIIASVEDIADQTHLLALNAAIEAARAGEYGKGFAVVATEVKGLADQSRRATAQVGGILGDIQRGMNTAVMVTEAGTKSVGAGSELVARAGATITELADVVESATVAAEQIAASSGQQAAATAQISDAMRDVNAGIEQNLATSRQTEQVARDLDAVSRRMKALVGDG